MLTHAEKIEGVINDLNITIANRILERENALVIHARNEGQYAARRDTISLLKVLLSINDIEQLKANISNAIERYESYLKSIEREWD